MEFLRGDLIGVIDEIEAECRVGAACEQAECDHGPGTSSEAPQRLEIS